MRRHQVSECHSEERVKYKVKAKWTMDKETIAQLQKELSMVRQAGAGPERNQSLLERLNIQAPPAAGSAPGAWGGAAGQHLD